MSLFTYINYIFEKFQKIRGTIMNLYELNLSELSRLIHNNVLSPTKLLDSILQRIEKLEPEIRGWVTIDLDKSIYEAEKCTKEAEEYKFRGILHGIPIGVKDIFYTANMKTTASSKVLQNFIPNYDAYCITKLKASGAIILGKTETAEFAYSDPAPTKNPWNLEHTPGGSSSGSAAAVSAGMCPASLGSQTGGSTIRPAAYCGIIGLKPTYDRISRHGMIPLSWSLDHVGFFTRSIEDTSILFKILTNYDLYNMTTLNINKINYKHQHKISNPLNIGYIKGYFYDNAQDDVKNNIDKVIEKFENSGSKINELNLPINFNIINDAHNIIMSAEAASYHEKNIIKYLKDYGPKIRGLILSGFKITATKYLLAQRIRSRIIQEIFSSIRDYDLILTPSTITPAPKGLQSTGSSIFNKPWSFCGLPAITIPSGFSKKGLPLGIQLIGKQFDDENLLKLALWCKKVIGVKIRLPFI